MPLVVPVALCHRLADSRVEDVSACTETHTMWLALLHTNQLVIWKPCSTVYHGLDRIDWVLTRAIKCLEELVVPRLGLDQQRLSQGHDAQAKTQALRGWASLTSLTHLVLLDLVLEFGKEIGVRHKLELHAIVGLGVDPVLLAALIVLNDMQAVIGRQQVKWTGLWTGLGAAWATVR